MPGGKRKLAQLFTSQMKIDGSGTTIKRMLAGSVAFATPGCAVEGQAANACIVCEATIANLTADDAIVGSVEGLSACVVWHGQVLAGTGQASVVLHLSPSNSSGSMDASAAGGLLRYIAFKV